MDEADCTLYNNNNTNVALQVQFTTCMYSHINVYSMHVWFYHTVCLQYACMVLSHCLLTVCMYGPIKLSAYSMHV